ncbi:MAG: type II toxin-antitoxin system VapC family toxin [Thermoanaerobaculia bacterium]
MIVLDASAALEILLQTPAGSSMTARVLEHEEDLHAPHLLDVEIAQALRRLCLRGHLGSSRAAAVLEDLSGLPLERHGHDLLLPCAWELRENLTVYDAVYVALAELLQVPLLTRDTRIRNAPGHVATVEVF